MRHPALLVALAGIVASPSFAQPLAPAGSIADAAVPLAERAQTQGAASLRGAVFPPGSIITMRDELENFPVGVSLGGLGVDAAPTSFTGPDGFDWGLNTLRGQTSINFVQVVDLSGSPTGGNATRAIRLRTAAAQAPYSFFLGATIRWASSLIPAAGANARVSADHFVSTIAERYTYEPRSVLTGFFIHRVMWGGECIEIFPGDCAAVGLPIGPLTVLSVLAWNPLIGQQELVPTRYCVTRDGVPIPGCTPPSGAQVGDAVSTPVGSWFRLITETTADHRFTIAIDALDGGGEVLIYEDALVQSNLLDSIAWNSSFGASNAIMLLDTIEASGPPLQPPVPPALECPYLDDLEWLDNFPVIQQQQDRWTAAPTSGLLVVPDDAQGGVLLQTNTVFPNNQHRREFATELPREHATLANDLVVSFDARFDGNAVRAFALLDGDQTIARLFRGHEDRTTPGAPVYTPSLFVQTNRWFNPVDDSPADPDAVNPVVGVDIEDTGVIVPQNGQYHTITLRLAASGALRVYVNDALAYAGPAAFGPSFDTLAFESENNASSPGSELRIDDVRMACDAPSCATDFDFDGMTGFADLNAALGNFGVVQFVPGFLPGDANGDSTVDFTDLNAILAAFGTSCD